MKKNYYQLTPQVITQLIVKEWYLITNPEKLHKTTLETLGITSLDVNWVLHLLEWTYQMNISAENVPLEITLREFVQLVLQSSNQQKAEA